MGFTFCILGSGSTGNCALVRAGRTTVMIDAGFSGRETARRLEVAGLEIERLDGILLTHEHGDHAGGAASVSRRWQAPVFCRPAAARRARLGKAAWGMEPLPETSFDLGDLRITPFEVSHDAVETVGFVIEGEGVRLGYVTDLGRSTPAVSDHLRGCQVLAVEANHDVELTRDGPYPWALKERILGERGHLSNEAAGDLLASVMTPSTVEIVLAHVSRTNNRPHLAEAAGRAGVERSPNPAATLRVAGQAEPAPVIRL